MNGVGNIFGRGDWFVNVVGDIDGVVFVCEF